MTAPDPKEIIIREGGPRDAETIVGFLCAMAAESENRRLDPAVVRRGLERSLARPELCRYYLAETEGRVAGQTMITFEWSDWRAAFFWWIQSVYVRPECRRRGVFRALYEHVLREARRRPDVCGVRLYVEKENAAAIRTYERLGLRRSSHLFYELDWSDLAAGGP